MNVCFKKICILSEKWFVFITNNLEDNVQKLSSLSL